MIRRTAVLFASLAALTGAQSCTRPPLAPAARGQGTDLPPPPAVGAPISPADAVPGGAPVRFDAARPSRLTVLRAPTGHLLVTPLVNGIPAGWFIFDTGAGMCAVSSPHLAALGLTESGQIDAKGIGGAASAALTRVRRFELGPLTLRDHPLLVTDLSFLRAHLGQEIVGVIGFGVLSHCVAEIDPQAERIALFDPATFQLEGATWIPVDLTDRIPALRARFEDREGLFHIDTGANGGVSFTARAVERWKLLDGRAVQDAQLGGVGGFLAAKRGTLAWFEVGGLRQEDVGATFPLESKGVLGGTRIDGSLGAQVLRPFVLVTDYAGSRVALRQRSERGG